MSDAPAIAVWEFDSIAIGINAADAIAKGSPVASLLTGTTHPGKYVVLVGGDTASVDVARDIVRDQKADVADHRFLPDPDRQVTSAVLSDATVPATSAEAVGVVETSSVSSGIDASDAGVKAADVRLAALRLADGIGGKAYLVVEGTVGEVEAAVAAAQERAAGSYVASVVIPQITSELRDDLAASARFLDRVRTHGDGS